MQIKNSTLWDKKDLQALFKRCVKEVDTIEYPDYPFYKRSKHFILEIKNGNKQKYVSGRAVINGFWIHIKIPIGFSFEKEKNIQKMSFKNSKELAKIMLHEYYHTIGFKEQDKNNYKNDWTKKMNVDFVKEYPLHKKVKEEKVALKDKRYQLALKNLIKATTRKKRADTLYKKWLHKVKYYEKDK